MGTGTFPLGNGGAAAFPLRQVTQQSSGAHGQSAELRSADTPGLCFFQGRGQAGGLLMPGLVIITVMVMAVAIKSYGPGPTLGAWHVFI